MNDEKTKDSANHPNTLAKFHLGFDDCYEFRIFHTLLKILEKTKNYYEPICISYRDILKTFNEKIYTRLKQACENITKKVINLKYYSKDSFEFVSIITTAGYEKGVIKIKFHELVVPYIENMIKDGYTKIYSRYIYPIKSYHSIEIYRQLIIYPHRQKGIRIFTIEEFRKLLNLKNKLSRPVHIKNSILIPAQENLKKYTDISFEFNFIREKIKVTHIEFLIKPNKPSYDPEFDEIQPLHKELIINPKQEDVIFSDKEILPICEKEKEDILKNFDYESKIKFKNLFTLNALKFVDSQSDRIKNFKISKSAWIFGFLTKYENDPVSLNKLAEKHFLEVKDLEKKLQQKKIEQQKIFESYEQEEILLERAEKELENMDSKEAEKLLEDFEKNLPLKFRRAAQIKKILNSYKKQK